MRTMGDFAENISHGYSIAERHDPGHVRFDGYGEREGVTAGQTDDIYQGGEQFIDFPSTAAGEQLLVVSDATGDNGAGASGVRTLMIHYLDTAGTTQHETVTMNATTPVSLTATGVTFVNFMHVASVGSVGVATGTLYIYQTGATGNLYNCIVSGANMSLSAARKVPTGQEFFMTEWEASIAGNKGASVRLRATAIHGKEYPGVFMAQDVCNLFQSAYVRHFDVPISFPENTIIKLSAKSSAGGGGGNVSGSFGGWLHS